ncbi:MAG: hypothetical protein ACE5LS_02315 [Thermoplasmata archaeon]
MKPRTVLLIVVGVAGALILGSIGFILLQRFLAQSLLPGDQALELLQGAPYSKLLIEVDHTPGDAPEASALVILQTRLLAYTAKESVEITSGVIAVNQTTFDTLDLLELERAHRDSVTGGDTFTLYILSIAGELANGGESALAAAYTASSLAIFKDVISRATLRPGPSLAEVEASVLVHEVGHLMGLVNLVYTSDLDYEDPAHPFHSDNSTDVMYWAIESAPFIQPPNDFGAETRFDLQKLRDGEYPIVPSRLRDLASALDFAGRTHNRWALFEIRLVAGVASSGTQAS